MSPLDTLARLRTLSARESPEVVELGKKVLDSRVKLGEQEWPIREQIAIAALDVGDVELAESQIAILSRRFPSSPRLLILQALHLESLGKYTSARIVYHCLLGKREGVEVPRLALDGDGEKEGRGGLGVGQGEGEDDGTEGVRVMAIWKGEPDECFVTAHQRLITLALYPPPSLSTGTAIQLPSTSSTTPTPSPQGIQAALPLLTRYLETFHSDPDAWSLLADLYVLSTPALAPLPTTTTQAGTEGWGIDALFANGTSHLVSLKTALQTNSSSATTKETYLPQALTSLAQQILLEPWNPRPLVRFAELSLLQGDVQVGFRTLLRCVEMMSEPFGGANDPREGDTEVKRSYEESGAGGKEWRRVMRVGGWKTRVWWDLALCTTILTNPSYQSSTSMTATPVSAKTVEAVRELVVVRLEALLGAPGVVEQWERGLMSE
ncbi:hypothetical protein QFC21_006685 [Naganishia friedmannii]|uniref:Uncharacterized protein n=1 Tax=Naganishia friedmannii TaxID=89922 RepID=A0ACC2V0U0_9TREE|nr:hypothetical protein QFC21_006685 [Naganishia friedmannii]